MNDKQQLAAMGAQYRLTEEQAKLLAERMPQSGVLQILDVEPLCMAKRIGELEAQVRVMAGLLREARPYMDHRGGAGPKGYAQLSREIDAALAGKLPEQHPDDAAVDRFAAAMKAKLAAAREKGRGGWDDPEACSVEFLAYLLVGHIGKGNPGNFEDIANLAMMLHQRGADPAVLAGHAPVPDAPEGCAMLYVGSGMFAKCDWEDWPCVMGYWWRLSTERGSTRYAQAHDSHDTLKRKRVAMHRMILSARDGDVVDHINGDGLDNRRSNLRIVTIQQNAFNQKHHGGSSRHKGVSYRADSGTWRAYITKDGKRRYLGTFASEDDAARAYNNEAERLFGEHAKLNAAAPSLDGAK